MSSALEVWGHNHSATREVPIKYCLIKVCTLFFKKNKVCILLSLFLLLAFRVYWGFPGGSDGKESACNVIDLGSIPGLGRFPWRKKWLRIGDWNAKVGSQETPGVTGKLGLGIRNEAGQRLIEFCQENALVITNTLFHCRLDSWSWKISHA